VDTTAVTLVLGTVFLWGVVSARAQRAHLSAPMVFVTAGFLLAEPLGVLDLQVEHEAVKAIAEITLVWVLFADAAGVDLKRFRADLGIYGRLLGVGLPLTVGLGVVVAMWLLDLDAWAALLLAAALAPTDAALGASVMTNPDVPGRVRRMLNVESGLNDGIATPVVLLAIAGVAAGAGIEGVDEPGRASVALLVGLLVGTGVGFAGGTLTRQARRHGLLTEDFAGPAVLALALLAYTCALLVDGNGFVAAFVGGLAFGATAGRGGEKEVYYIEQTAALASAFAWLIFGALALPLVGDWLDWRVVLYAVISLTAIRMLPVAIALFRSDVDRGGVAFIGWFGPRGLASVIFALLATEALGTVADEIVATISLTVTLSVVAHGITAGPLAARYGRSSTGPGYPAG